jgi:threonine/homoserine/homoserine lactone efflux protein
VLWGLWHLPVVDSLGAASPHGSWWPEFFAAFIAVLAAIRVLIAWTYEHTGRPAPGHPRRPAFPEPRQETNPMMGRLIAFAAFSAIVVVTPGPSCAAQHPARGRRDGFGTACGAAAGSLGWGLASVAGLTAIIAASAQLYRAVQLAGAAYLVFLGIRGWRTAHPPAPDAAGQLGRRILLVPVLFAAALAIAAALNPAGNTASGWLAGIYPHWLLPSYNSTTGYSQLVLVPTLLATVAIDGLINPAVEELYFRGYLLPRLPVTGWRAVPLSAALFSLQHYWQPWNWLLIFVLQLVLTTPIVRLRCLRLGIVMHILTNSFGILTALLGVLA